LATERSDAVYGYWRDASEKFDYFVTGLTGALVAFIGERLQPTPLGPNAATVEVAALLLLIASVMVGFKRIEVVVTSFRLMYQRTYRQEARGALVSAYQGGGLLNSSTGDVLSPVEIEHKVGVLEAETDAAEKHLEELAVSSASLYRWRNRLLLAGFLTLVASRILAAYL
jgi:hypothetical protein